MLCKFIQRKQQDTQQKLCTVHHKKFNVEIIHYNRITHTPKFYSKQVREICKEECKSSSNIKIKTFGHPMIQGPSKHQNNGQWPKLLTRRN